MPFDRRIQCAAVLTLQLLVATATAEPPEGAIWLLNGDGAHQFVSMSGEEINWPTKDGELVSTANGRRSNHIVSRLHFRDAEIHVEFLIPKAAKTGNSGLYIHGLFEVQILDSFDKQEVGKGDMGAVYGLYAPAVNASAERGEWQSLDVHFVAPRRDENDKVTDPGQISAWLNGQQIHDAVAVSQSPSKYNPYRYDTTPYLKNVRTQLAETMAGPLVLQDHDNPVRFRNVWVKPLDDSAHFAEAE